MRVKKLLSTSDAGKALGISRIAVFKKIRSGRMAAIMIGGTYAISPTALAQERVRIEKREKARAARAATRQRKRKKQRG